MKERIRAFSLLELLVVLAVLALCSALILPVFSAFLSRLSLQSATSQVLQDLNELSEQAKLSNASAQMTILPDGRHYALTGVGQLRTTPSGVRIFLNGGVQNVLEFGTDGRPGQFVLHLRAGERRVSIRSDWLTGRMEVIDGND